ncbi:hypothetical protein ACU5AX_00320 [Sphingomonas sp. XXL09]|uniref:hypothetical protein n=1 Tax=Sphingomonas sp. XXL09 TaxID=3457787 RepID=UPI00406BB36E
MRCATVASVLLMRSACAGHSAVPTVAARWRAMFVPLNGRGQTPGARAALLDRSIPLCDGAPIT